MTLQDHLPSVTTDVTSINWIASVAFPTIPLKIQSCIHLIMWFPCNSVTTPSGRLCRQLHCEACFHIYCTPVSYCLLCDWSTACCVLCKDPWRSIIHVTLITHPRLYTLSCLDLSLLQLQLFSLHQQCDFVHQAGCHSHIPELRHLHGWTFDHWMIIYTPGLTIRCRF